MNLKDGGFRVDVKTMDNPRSMKKKQRTWTSTDCGSSSCCSLKKVSNYLELQSGSRLRLVFSSKKALGSVHFVCQD